MFEKLHEWLTFRSKETPLLNPSADVDLRRRQFCVQALVTLLCGRELFQPDKAEAKTRQASPPHSHQGKKSIEKQSPTQLEQTIRAHIIQMKKEGVLKPDMKVSVFAQDITTGRDLVSINENASLQAASMIKPFVALAFFHQVQRNILQYTQAAKQHMVSMINRSNNQSTNWFIQNIGGPKKVQEILSKNYPHIFRNTHIVEAIPPGGRTYRNTASAKDYARFNSALWYEKIPGAHEIKRVMALEKRNRIYSEVPEIPEGTMVIDKTGTTSRLVGDMGIVVAKEKNGQPHPYIFSMAIESPRRQNTKDFSRNAGGVIRDISGMVFTEVSDSSKKQKTRLAQTS